MDDACDLLVWRTRHNARGYFHTQCQSRRLARYGVPFFNDSDPQLRRKSRPAGDRHHNPQMRVRKKWTQVSRERDKKVT